MYKLVHGDNIQTKDEYEAEMKDMFGDDYADYMSREDYNFPFETVEEAEALARKALDDNRFVEKVYLVKVLGVYNRPKVEGVEFEEVE